MSVRSRGWCFTVQSWSEDACALVSSLYEEDNNCVYLIIGWEIAPRTFKEHLQCYIYYTNPVRFTEMQNRLPGVHIEPQKAKKNVEAYYYCMEGGDYLEFGERPRQGHRSDLAVIASDIRVLKKTPKEISKDYPTQWVQYRRSFDELARLHISYSTVLVIYDSESIPLIYKRYPMETSLILKSQYDMPPSHVLHEYYSSRYQYIFVPWYPDIDEHYKGIEFEVI